MHKLKTLHQLPNDWHKVLKKQCLLPDLSSTFEKIQKDIKQNKKIFPEVNNIYKALELCSYEKTKVVIFGQDPYHKEGQANGLAFGVNPNIKIPPSLRNIYKEINDDIGSCKYNLGNLEGWASQGVLLLNSSLSVCESKPNSHKNYGWDKLIFSIIKSLNNKKEVIFILWGKDSIKKENLIDLDVNFVLKAAHPSPLSSYRGFFGCKHFSLTNEILVSLGKNPITW